MDKSSITWTRGSDWWLSRTTMGGKERYPKQIRVGDLDRPRVYYPIDRDALLALADECENGSKLLGRTYKWSDPTCASMATTLADEYGKIARRIRKALGASDG